ncbi:hypothetical protein [Streptomyces sp. NPDC056987]|uniref:hypothetical protein n=1 Tax=Streptomyces sp. NPDC056987 TaxID=3345988 RepID=UPI00362C65C3
MKRTLILFVAAAALLVPATVPEARADYTLDSSACTRNDKDHWRQNDSRDSSVPVRTGPGSQYSAKARLAPLGLLRVYCSATSKAGNRWYYGKASLDTNGGRYTTGWVWGGNLMT